MASYTTVAVNIDLLTCARCTLNSNSSGAIRPGDSLEGWVRVTSPLPIHFTYISVSFQGLQSTIVRSARSPDTGELVAYSPSYYYPVITKSSNLFLDVSHPALLDSIEIQERKDCPSNYSFPFFFVLPRGTELADREKPILCRMLPPSLKISHSQPDSQTITYKIHAVIGYRAKHGEVASETDERLDTIRTIDFLPYSEAQPPTHVSDFPDEFTLKASSPIWRHVLGGRLGSLNVITSEPLPLAYSPYHSQPTTDCTLSIVVHAPLTIQRLRAVSLDVSLTIRFKTFYSTEPMSCLPTQALLAHNALVRLHDQTVKLGRKDYTQLDWVYYPRLEGTEPPPYNCSRRDDALRGDLTNLGNVAHGDHTWKTSVQVPIEPSVTLLPSFCSSFIARSYSLLLHVRVMGIRTRKIDLELPLQVVHLRPAQVRTDSMHEEGPGSCIGPAGLLAREKVLPTY